MTAHSPSARGRGYSLIETLAALATAGVLAATAGPLFMNAVFDARLVGGLNTLLADLYFARAEAVKRAAPVTICKSPDGRRCALSGGWHQGWIVFAGAGRTPERGAVLRVQPPLQRLSITFRAFGSRHYMTYLADGTTRRNGTFTFCDRRGAQAARALVLYKTGRVRSARRHPSGGPLRCT